MSELIDFLRTHEEAFRSRARLASLYSDFRHQRQSNPDGYQANTSAWLRALTAAAGAGLIPAQTGAQTDHFVLHANNALLSALQTPDLGQPLALGSVIEDAVQKRALINLGDFLKAEHSIYAKSWIPSPWDVVSWGLQQLGLAGMGASRDKLVSGQYVITANVEAASKAVIDHASKITPSNTARIMSKDLFISTFKSSIGVETISVDDLSVLLTHLARDCGALAYSPSKDTIKFRAPTDTRPPIITKEDESIASLRTMIVSLQAQCDELTSQLSSLEQKARQAVASKQLVAAKSALRSKKLVDTKLQQRTATLGQLEEIYAKIEQAADQVDVVRVMESSSKTLKSLNQQTGGVEKVQDVVDGLRDEMMTVDEIGSAINEVSAGNVDEVEVEDELEALEKAEKEKQEAIESKKREEKERAEAEATRKKLAELDQTDEKAQAEKADKQEENAGSDEQRETDQSVEIS